MKDKKNQQQIILAVLAVALVGVIIYSVLPSGKASPPPDQKTNTGRASTGAGDDSLAGGIDKNGVSTGVVPDTVFPGLANPTPRRDPFAIQESAASQMKSSVSGSLKVPKMPSIARNPLKPVNPFKMNAALPGIQNVTVIPPAKPILSGVLIGRNNVAIIRYGGRTYVVNEGSFFAGRYRLLRVSNNSVVLQDRSTQIRIGLGGLK